jgi:RNA 2',3'-cyclic 3'-phosphodiesterase
VKRLFIAIDVDEHARDAIARISSDLRTTIDPRSRMSWVRPERMHLTLHFFAHADEVLERRILSAFDEPVREPSFRLAFEGLGFFPERGSPRVLWLGVREGLAELRRLHQILTGRLSRALPPGAAKPFTPHLTLARFRSRVPRGQIEDIGSIQASAGPCAIDRVTLYESHLSSAGPAYLRLAEAALTT